MACGLTLFFGEWGPVISLKKKQRGRLRLVLPCGASGTSISGVNGALKGP